MVFNKEKLTLNNFSSEYYEDCFKLQAKIWGKNNIIPVSIFSVAKSIGGVAMAAIYEEQFVGFILSLPAIFDGEISQWSCRLAVSELFQNCGIGGRLKRKQKECLLKNNINSLMWSFDPLNLKNAHLNLNKLGAVIVQFNEDLYPGDQGKRAIVKWDLNRGERDSDINVNHIDSYANIGQLPNLIALEIKDKTKGFNEFSKQLSFLIDNKYQGVSLKAVNNIPNYIFKKIQ